MGCKSIVRYLFGKVTKIQGGIHEFQAENVSDNQRERNIYILEKSHLRLTDCQDADVQGNCSLFRNRRD